MSGFDDIFEQFDDITAPEADEKAPLGVSEVEKTTGMWNAQDDGGAWSADDGNSGGAWNSGGGDPNDRVWNVDDGKAPDVGPMSGSDQGPMPGPNPGPSIDDRASEDEVLDEFLDEDDYDDGGSGAFDDIF